MSVSYAGIARIRFYGLARRPLSSYEHPNGLLFMTYQANFIKTSGLGILKRIQTYVRVLLVNYKFINMRCVRQHPRQGSV